MGLDKTLLWGFFMGIKMALFNVTKSLKDYRVTLKRVTMAAKWTSDQNQGWKSKETDACKNSLQLAYQALNKAKERRHS